MPSLLLSPKCPEIVFATPPHHLFWGVVPSPVGDLWGAVNEHNHLAHLKFAEHKTPLHYLQALKQKDPNLSFTEDQKTVRPLLSSFLSGALTATLTLSTTNFRLALWKQLTMIPFGTTITYGELALRINNPKAVRAVGTACGANPVVILIPCHRVVARHGPGGFSAPLAIKGKLLRLEKEDGSLLL